ncbi:cytochrome P450 [Suillus clintonianus]|uniref:cytochrome P450 n=1 Tax=Suillus clintonianus TaxID=1904413 RepID=UPI001B870480|nr:cytochrome P450 [Suillus clintonianus]KAG2153235.1 cytochrome P450 [Suillus clintonianus]
MSLSLIQLCVLGTFSFTLYKVLNLLLRRPHGIDLDGPDRGNWLLGNVISLFEGGIDYCVNIAEKYGGAVRLHGPYGETIYVSDPRALHHIVVKDQHIFEEPDDFIMSNQLVFGEGLISTVGEQHRRQRKLISPVFSTSNMRRLLSTVHHIADRLASTLAAKLPADGSHNEIDILPWLSRCALDGISQCILGYPSNTLSTAEDGAYTEALQRVGPLIGKLCLLRPFVLIVVRCCSPYWARKILDLITVPWLPTQFMRDVREMRRIAETMDSVSRKKIAEKKAAMEADDMISGDGDSILSMMDIMLKANSVLSNATKLTDAELLGQMNVMAFAGLDTTTSALARSVYLLAQHPRAQARLRSEVADAMKSSRHLEEDGIPSAELPFDVLMNLPFLDGVVKETLRLYPSLPLMIRTATKATTLPLHFPARSRSGADTSVVTIPQGTHIIISILAANRHQEIWGADANDWRPERWLSSPLAAPSETHGIDTPVGGEDAVSVSRRTAPILGVQDGVRFPGVYSNMMTFLGGSRSCIGFKFAEMEIKQVLATLVLRLHFSLPTERNAQGHVKEIQWKLKGFHIPVVKSPAGDGVTPQVPLNVRQVREEDFIW